MRKQARHSDESPSRKLVWGLFVWLLIELWSLASGATPANNKLTVQFQLQHEGSPVPLGTLSQTNQEGQKFSVTRFDCLCSDFAVRRLDGCWLEQTNWQALISLAGKRMQFSPPALPADRYDCIRFKIGVVPGLNHGDPAQYAPDHPLNPNLNGLHWGWQGGYVFLAIEGRWQNPNGTNGGYSFHLGNDRMLTSIELPAALDLTQDRTITTTLHLNRLFGGKPTLIFNEDNSATHSREGDVLADRLHTQLETAFSLDVPPASAVTATDKPAVPRKRLLGSKATPYRFTFSRQFPPPELPADNPISNEGVALGRRLFNDKLLSVNGQQSCASCHDSNVAFTDTRRFSLGTEGQVGVRHAMPLFNLAWKQSFFWDGRAPSLREQVLMPIENPIEMHESLTNVVQKLVMDKDYPSLFELAFGSKEIDADRMARALEQFLLTLVSYRSKFDRAIQGEESLTEQEKRGFELFVTEYDPRRGFYGADCFHCHGGPFFTTHGFANNGLDDKFQDAGLGEITGREFDRGRFAVPSLRNVAVTAPYMHDGRFKTLEEVIEHYSTGVKSSPTLDPNIAKHPPGGVPLSEADKKALVAFLKTLTDETFVPLDKATAGAAAPSSR